MQLGKWPCRLGGQEPASFPHLQGWATERPGVWSSIILDDSGRLFLDETDL